MRILATLAAILLLTIGAAAQIVYVPTPSTPQACTKELSDLPVIKGVRMGMERRDFEMFIQTAFRDQPGDEQTYLGYSFSNVELKPLRFVEIGYFHDRIVDLTLNYWAADVPFDHQEEFAKVVAEQFGLPNSWKSTMLGLGLQMHCSDFTIAVEKRSSSFRITDTKAAKAKEDAAKEEVERKKKEFKIT